MYTDCIVSHLLALFFYAAKKPELHSNKKKKKKKLLLMNLDTNLTMQESARDREHLLLKSNRRLKLIIFTFDPPSAPKIKNRENVPVAYPGRS